MNLNLALVKIVLKMKVLKKNFIYMIIIVLFLMLL